MQKQIIEEEKPATTVLFQPPLMMRHTCNSGGSFF